jgi:hypothetical protein
MMAAQGAPEAAIPAAPEPETPDAPDVSQPEDASPEVSDQPPEIIPPPEEEVTIVVPQVSARPQARPAERVAPTPVAQPEPEAQVDPVVREEADPNAASDTPQPDEPATAPQEAVTEIVPEAQDEVSAAPTKSVRPKVRPNRPAPQPETETASTSNAVNSALAEALAGGESAAAQTGTNGQSGADPLSQGEKDALIVAVSDCWSVDPGAASGKVTVVVSVTLNRDGTLSASPKFVSATGGDQTAVDVAFRKARTAVISCGRRGFDLPEEKYEHWREIEMTFNPEKMRLR